MLCFEWAIGWSWLYGDWEIWVYVDEMLEMIPWRACRLNEIASLHKMENEGGRIRNSKMNGFFPCIVRARAEDYPLEPARASKLLSGMGAGQKPVHSSRAWARLSGLLPTRVDLCCPWINYMKKKLGSWRMFDENESQNMLRVFYFDIVHLKLENVFKLRWNQSIFNPDIWGFKYTTAKWRVLTYTW